MDGRRRRLFALALAALMPLVALVLIGPTAGARPAVADPTEPSHAHRQRTTPIATRESPRAGPAAGGTVVTFRGAHLGDVRAVWFDDRRGRRLHVRGPHLLRVTAPGLPPGLSGAVAVYAQVGNRRTRIAHFRYLPPPPPPVVLPVVTGVSPGVGPPGTAVSITGNGFTQPFQVTFGDRVAEVRSVSPGELSVTAPPHDEGDAVVQVHTAAGTSPASAATQFHYLATDPGPPVVSVVGPSYGPVAGGTSVHIQGTNLTHATQVVFGDTPASFTSDGAGNLDAISPPHVAGRVEVRVVNALGTSDPADGPLTYFDYESPQPSVASVAPWGGPPSGGTRVTVTGQGLTGALRVTFDGVPGTDLAVLSDTQLQVTAPAHVVASAKVVVTNAQKSSFVFLQTYFNYSTDLRVQTTPLPGDVEQYGPDLAMAGVACGAPGQCVAVGTYTAVIHDRDGRRALAETLSGGVWRAVSLPSPADAPTIPDALYGLELDDVQCPTATSCFAVGRYESTVGGDQNGNDGYERPLVYQWDSGTWTVVPIPIAAGAGQTGLDKLRCVSTTSCLALGTICRSGGCLPLAVSFDGTTWTATTIGPPRGAGQLYLEDVDCWAADGCLAVGSSSGTGDSQDNLTPVYERWDGVRWRPTAGLVPLDASSTYPDASLLAVSCTAEGCHATGRYRLEGADGLRQAYVSTITTAGETVERLPLPPDAVPDARIYDEWIDCATFDYCRAAAYYQSGTSDDPYYKTLDATIQPGSITVEVVPSAPGSSVAWGSIEDLICPSTAGCLGVSRQGYSTLAATSSTTSLTGPPVPTSLGDYPHGYPLALSAVAADSPTTAVAISAQANYNPTQLGVLVTGIPVPAP